MLRNFCKSSRYIVSATLMFMLTIAACDSPKVEKKEDPATVAPANTAPAADTTHMDTATTRPVKGGN